MALSDMVDNGFPEQFKLELISKNMAVFASKLRQLVSVNALMGAGTHPGSDTTSSATGIVYGHAYAVLDV